MIAFAAAAVAVIVLISVGLTVVEFRKIKPLLYHCRRCGHDFKRPAHEEFPATCPKCAACDWNA
jgi:rubrerythrin